MIWTLFEQSNFGAIVRLAKEVCTEAQEMGEREFDDESYLVLKLATRASVVFSECLILDSRLNGMTVSRSFCISD